jgi:hypothetical protein
MRIVRWSLAATAFGLLLVGSAPRVSAGIEGSNGCRATGTWRGAGLTVDAATADGVIVIPRSDTVDWQGSVAAPPGTYHGSVWVELPPPFGHVVVGSWKGDSQTTSNSGAHEYDLPSLVPAGVEFTVAGEHIDQNGTCSGSVTVEVDGGAFDSPLTAVSLVGTAATGAGLAALLRPLFRRVA